MLEDFSSNSKGKRTYAYTILFLELKTLNVLFERDSSSPVGSGIPSSETYDQKSFAWIRARPECCEQTSLIMASDEIP
ncbi:hypothetical protein Tco_0590480 [Tanacetum coccineum]